MHYACTGMYKLSTLLNDEIDSFNISDEPPAHNVSSIHLGHIICYVTV